MSDGVIDLNLSAKERTLSVTKFLRLQLSVVTTDTIDPNRDRGLPHLEPDGASKNL